MFFEPMPGDSSITVFDAIRKRRATRSYTQVVVPEDLVLSLITFATLAPSARNQHNWNFVVVKSKSLLIEICNQTKLDMGAKSKLVDDPDFDIFYGCTTLVIICIKVKSHHVFESETDCYLAGENLMLAATGMALATCPIGCAIPALNELQMLEKLGLSPDHKAILPIIVGYASGESFEASKHSPQVHWIRD